MNESQKIPSSKEATKPQNIKGSSSAKEKGNLIIDQVETQSASKAMNTEIISVSNSQVTFKQNKNGDSMFLIFKNNKLNLKKTTTITFDIEYQNIATNQKANDFCVASVSNGWASSSKTGYGEEVKGSAVRKGDNKYQVTINIDPDKLEYKNEYKKHPNDFRLENLKMHAVMEDPGNISVKNLHIEQK